MPISRRRFLAGAAAAGAGLALPLGETQAKDREDLLRPMPTRKLGRTGLTVSALALGTHPLGRLKNDETAVAIVQRALELGVTYFDTAPSYSRHRAERRLGLGLSKARDRVVIATKSYETNKTKALAELDASLKALGTDHVDVFQIHSIRDEQDRDAKFSAKGTLGAALAAQKAGKCRFIGVTGHVDPRLMASCLDEYRAFDTLLVPVNCADPLHESFVEHTLPKAKERGVGVVAMKVFAAGKLVGAGEKKATPDECVRWVLSQGVATATVGADSVEQLEADILAAKRFKPLSSKEQGALTERFAPHPGKSLEWYKRD